VIQLKILQKVKEAVTVFDLRCTQFIASTKRLGHKACMVFSYCVIQ